MGGTFGDFTKLTDAFTAAAMDSSRWDAAMDVAAEATGSFGALLLPVRGRTPLIPIGESMRPTMDVYFRDGWGPRDERFRSLPTFLRRGVVSEFDFTTEAEIARSPYYQELLRPQGLRWFAGVKVGETDDAWGLMLQRTPAEGPFSPDELGASPNCPAAWRAQPSWRRPWASREWKRRWRLSRRAARRSRRSTAPAKSSG